MCIVGSTVFLSSEKEIIIVIFAQDPSPRWISSTPLISLQLSLPWGVNLKATITTQELMEVTRQFSLCLWQRHKQSWQGGLAICSLCVLSQSAQVYQTAVNGEIKWALQWTLHWSRWEVLAWADSSDAGPWAAGRQWWAPGNGNILSCTPQLARRKIFPWVCLCPEFQKGQYQILLKCLRVKLRNMEKTHCCWKEDSLLFPLLIHAFLCHLTLIRWTLLWADSAC